MATKVKISSDESNTSSYLGKVRCYDIERGYGIIDAETGEKVGVHWREVYAMKRPSLLCPDDIVRFSVMLNPDPHATRIVVIETVTHHPD
jgi:cold shock CspA family protein